MRTVREDEATFDPLATVVPPPAVPKAAQVVTPEPAPAAVEDHPPETTAAESDPRYFSIHHMLPSGMAFYTFSKLSIRPYGLAEKFKLGAATKSGSIRFIVEAVGACIDRPIMQIALMDFWFMCYWLRVQSYTKMPFSISWACEDRNHLKTVLLDDVPEETRINQTMVQNSDLTTKPLDVEKLMVHATTLAHNDLFLQVPTVADFLEKIENGADWPAEFSFMADLAVYLRADRHGQTIRQRVAVVNGFAHRENGEVIMDALLNAQRLLEEGGMEESVKAKCKHCGVEQRVSVEVDLLTFFPFGV